MVQFRRFLLMGCSRWRKADWVIRGSQNLVEAVQTGRCVSSHKQARILETRFRPSGFAKYSSTEQITYVRDMFHCTACNSELSNDDYPCCEVSRKRSFNFWKGKYHDAEKTTRINARIDELLKENETLKKAMH